MKETLEQLVNKKLGEEIELPSATTTMLEYCSKKLEHVKTEEEFDEVLAQYSLLDDKLKKVGLYSSDFKKIIDTMKKDL